MRARAIREGSVGLLILIGIGLFGGLVVWLRGLNVGNRNYTIVATFENTLGMQPGTAVRFRGVPVGRVVSIRPESNQVEVVIEVTQSDLRMPRDVTISTNQSGFIGETSIDIVPGSELTEAEQAVRPTAPDCAQGVIICQGDRLQGETGVSFEALLRSAETLATTLADPNLISSLKSTLENASVFTTKATTLTDELTKLTRSTQAEIRPLSDSVQQATNSATDAAQGIQATAQEFQLTASDVRTLISANRLNLTSTLENLNRGSDRLAYLMETLATEVDNIDTRELLHNLEILSANAAEASINLRDASVDARVITTDVRALTGTLNQPANLLLIQQTLDSARDVFQSAQKILSDVDELTGDPALRDALRDLINNLGNLLSNTELLEQQTELAIALDPLHALTTPIALPVPSAPATPPPSPYTALHQQLATLSQATEAAPSPPE